MTTILLGAPTHEIKRYSIGQWAAAVGEIQLASKCKVLQVAVDTSPTPDFCEECTENYPFIMWLHHPAGPWRTPHHNIAYGMEWLRRFCVLLDYDYWLNIECDVIAPSQTADLMVEYAERGTANKVMPMQQLNDLRHAGKIDWLATPVPSRHDGGIMHTSFACTLFSRELVRDCSFQDAPAQAATDGWYLQRVVIPAQKYNVVDLPPGYVTVQHLRNPDPILNEKWF